MWKAGSRCGMLSASFSSDLVKGPESKLETQPGEPLRVRILAALLNRLLSKYRTLQAVPMPPTLRARVPSPSLPRLSPHPEAGI